MTINLQADKRSISFWDVIVQGVSRKRDVSSADPLDITSLFVQLQKYRITNRNHVENLTYDVATNKTSIVLEGISYDENNIKILMGVMDDKASRQIFRNVVTRRSRLTEKYEDERAEYSVHMIISRSQMAGLRHHYSCTVEECPASSVSYLFRALNAFLKQSAFKFTKKFEQKHPDNVIVDGKPEMMNTYGRLLILGHPAEDFQSTVRNGTLTGLSAITNYEIDNSVDGTQTIRPVAKEVKFSIARNVVSDDNWGYLEKVRYYSLDGKPNLLKVKFKDENGQPYSLSVDPASGRLLDEKKFIKKLVLDGFSEELSTSSEGCFNQELVAKMSDSMAFLSTASDHEKGSRNVTSSEHNDTMRLASEH